MSTLLFSDDQCSHFVNLILDPYCGDNTYLSWLLSFSNSLLKHNFLLKDSLCDLQMLQNLINSSISF